MATRCPIPNFERVPITRWYPPLGARGLPPVSTAWRTTYHTPLGRDVCGALAVSGEGTIGALVGELASAVSGSSRGDGIVIRTDSECPIVPTSMRVPRSIEEATGAFASSPDVSKSLGDASFGRAPERLFVQAWTKGAVDAYERGRYALAMVPDAGSSTEGLGGASACRLGHPNGVRTGQHVPLAPMEPARIMSYSKACEDEVRIFAAGLANRFPHMRGLAVLLLIEDDMMCTLLDVFSPARRWV